MTENKPEKTSLSLPAFSSLNRMLYANSLNDADRLTNLSYVIGGNISLMASLKTFTTTIISSNRIRTPSNNISRPPNAFHRDNNSFLASEVSFIIPPITSEMLVNRSFACPKSPIIISQVLPQPDCADSFKVSHN